MQFDWNIEKIIELKKRAGVQSENKTVAKHLEFLDLHLKNHQKTHNFELRKAIWEAVEEWAMKLDKLLDALNR